LWGCLGCAETYRPMSAFRGKGGKADIAGQAACARRRGRSIHSELNCTFALRGSLNPSTDLENSRTFISCDVSNRFAGRQPALWGTSVCGIPVFGSSADISRAVNAGAEGAVVFLGNPRDRERADGLVLAAGLQLPVLIHPGAYVAAARLSAPMPTVS